MSQYKKKSKGKTSTKLIHKNLEIPLNNGFRRAIVKRDSNRLLSVYYVTPDNKYLKGVPEVCDWIEKEKQEEILNRRYFNFIARKFTSHDNEFVIEYEALPPELKEDFIPKKRSIAPIIVMIENDDSVSSNQDPKIEVVSEITNDISKNEEAAVESDAESSTLSADSVDKVKKNTEAVVIKPQQPYEYPLAEVNMNSVIEIGSHCHIDRLHEVMNGDVDCKVTKLMKSNCGNHCTYDSGGFPRVAFECDICLILWHTDCVGYRWATIGSMSLIVCDNCNLLQKNLKVDATNIFCDVEKLLHSEFETSSGLGSMYIPLKIESIFRLCKFNWIIQSKKESTYNDFKLSKKTVKKESSKNPKMFRFFIKTFITTNSIIRDSNEDSVLLKFTDKDIDRMASIFADKKCEMQISDNCYMINTCRVSVRNEELLIPVGSKIIKNGGVIFSTYECGQDKDTQYIKRFEALKATMYNNCASKSNNQIPYFHKEPQYQCNNKKIRKSVEINYANNIVSQITGPLSRKYTLIPKTRFNIPSISHQNLPKNAIPISMEQIHSLSNIIKIRKRKQDFTTRRFNLMATNKATIQYHNLIALPFVVLENILTSKNLSTQDKLNCRVANRILKCVIDGGRVWSKVVINPGLITGLQTMFDFYSIRNVKKMTFKIDFQESFGIDFFTSFIGRLKLYPESFVLDSISVKLIGYNEITTKFRLSIQDILSCVKSLKCLSVSSDKPATIAIGKQVKLTSESLVKLKLKNIRNIVAVLNTHGEFTPNLRHVQCGDWSQVSFLGTVNWTHITSLIMNFSELVNLVDTTSFSMLISLQRLTVSRPEMTDVLGHFLAQILKHKSLFSFNLETKIVSKGQLNLCTMFGPCFPLHIGRVNWRIYLSADVFEPDFKKKISDHVSINVHVSVFNV